MAIIPSVPGLEVDICIGGQRAREYIRPVKTSPGANTVVRYIEAQSAKEFTITIRVQSPFEIETSAIVARVAVDGICVLGPLFRRDIYESKECLLTHTIHGVQEAGGVRALEFVEFSENVRELLEQEFCRKHASPQIGSIVVQLYACDVFKRWGNVPEQDLPIPPICKELGQDQTHAVAPGRMKKSIPSAAWKVRLTDSKLIGKFHFEYRSLEVLQDLDVVTFRPSPKKRNSYRALSNSPEPISLTDSTSQKLCASKTVEDDEEKLAEPNNAFIKQRGRSQDSQFTTPKKSLSGQTKSRKRGRSDEQSPSILPHIFHDVFEDEDRPSPTKKRNSPSKKVAKQLSRLSLRKVDVEHVETIPEVVDLIEEL